MKISITIVFCMAFLCCNPYFNYAQIPVIFTVAGNGTTTFGGDGAPAASAGLNNPSSVALGTAGNYYITDGGHSCLRKVSTTGGSTITTIAGMPNVIGYSGDGSVATNAKMFNPINITVDPFGDIVFCDSGNACLRKVSTTGGTITTIAGNASLGAGFSGEGVAATDAQISNNCSVAFDAVGNMYIADGGNSCLRKVSTTGGTSTITTIAGIPTVAGFFGDDGPATNAKLNNPTAIAIDSMGNIYVADGGNSCLRKVSTTGGTITTIAGTPTVAGFFGDAGPATAAQLNNPSGIAVTNGGKIFISDNGNSRMRVISPLGVIHTVAGTDTVGFNGDGPCYAIELNHPVGVCLDAANNCYIADRFNNRVRYINYTLLDPIIDQPLTNIKITPNPTQGSFTCQITTPQSGEVKIMITNVLGEKVKEVVASTNLPIEFALNVPAGIYLLNATSKQGSWAEKIVITKTQ